MRCSVIPLLLVVAFLAGCTAIRLGYPHADTYLKWRADAYFDLDPRQKRDLDARLERLLAWHRYEQLPEYAAFITAAADKARPGLKREDIIWFVDGWKARYRTAIDRAVGDAAELLQSITPDQIAHLQKQWRQDNRKFAREYELDGTLADRKLSRLKRTINQLEDWTGSLDIEQEHKIAALLEPIPHINHLRLQDRMRRQKDFVDLLKVRGNRAEFQARLQSWLRDWESGRSPEYAKLANEVFEQRIQFYIAVEKLLTPTQRQTAERRLQRFAEDFRRLSTRR